MLNMNALTYYMLMVCVGVFGINVKSDAKEPNLLKDGFASVVVSTDNIEALYVNAIEKNYELYVQLGADWDDEGTAAK